MMRVHPFALPLVFALAVSGCSGCETEDVNQTSGIFEMTPKSLDFGTGCLKDTTERIIELNNPGNADLEIQKVELKGDAYALLEEPPTVLPAGEVVFIKVGFTPQAADEFAGTLTITTDAEENPTQTTTILGAGFPGKKHDFRVLCSCRNDPVQGRICGSKDGAYDDCSFLSFQDVRALTKAEAHLKLRNDGCAPIDVNEALFFPEDASSAADVELFSFVGESTFQLKGQESKDVVVRFSAPDRESQPLVRLRFVSTDPEKKNATWGAGEWELGLFANSTLPALLVDPDILTFFEAQTGVALRKEVEISNTGTASLTIDSVSMTAEGGSQDFQLDLPNGETSFMLAPSGLPNSSRKVGIVYTSSGPGSDRAIVIVKAGLDTKSVRLLGGTEPLLVVKWVDPASGDERDPPIDFGTVDTGAKGTTRTVRLRNDGQAPLSITRVELPASDNAGLAYKIAAFSATTVPVGGHAEVVVTHDDVVTLRDDRAKLAITSNDPVDAATGGVRQVDVVSANEPNFAPVVSIQVSTAPTIGRELTLDGSGSTGPEPGDTLTYKWSISRKPSGSTVRLETPDAAVTRVISDEGAYPDVAGNYVFKLEVSDQFGNKNVPLSQSVNVR